MTTKNFGKILGTNNNIEENFSHFSIKVLETYRSDFNLHDVVYVLPETQMVTSVFHINSAGKEYYSEFAALLDDEPRDQYMNTTIDMSFRGFCKKNMKRKKQQAILFKKHVDDNLDIILRHFILEDMLKKKVLLYFASKARGCVEHRSSLERQALNLPEPTEYEIQGLMNDQITSVLDKLSVILAKYNIDTKLLGLFENGFILTFSLLRSQTRTDMCLAVINFYKSITKSNVLDSPFIQKAIRYVNSLLSDKDMERQALSKSDIRSVLSNYARFKKSPLFKRIEKIYMYCLSHALLEQFNISFTKRGYSELEAMAIKRKHENYPDMLFDVLDTSLYIIETIDQYMRTGSYRDILFGFTDVESWVDRCYDLDLKSKHLNNPEAAGFNIYSYLADLRLVIEQGDTLLKHDTGADKNVIKKLVHSMKKIDLEYRSLKVCQKSRKAPFMALIEGPSSIGKSSFKDILKFHYAKLFDLPDDDEHTYTRIFQDEFWSGFGSHMWCLILDDIAFMLGEKQPNGDESLREVIQIRNNVAFCPPQAALEDKGKTPFLGKLVVGSTNTLGLGAEEHFRCPIATLRRFDMPIRLKLKKQYQDTESGFLDPSKIPESDPERYDDLWDIIVCKVVPDKNDNRSSRGKFVKDKRFTNVNDFLAYFSERVLAHEKQQDKVLNGEQHKKGITICKKCYYVSKDCKCSFEQQSEEHDLFFDAYTGDEFEYFDPETNETFCDAKQYPNCPQMEFKAAPFRGSGYNIPEDLMLDTIDEEKLEEVTFNTRQSAEGVFEGPPPTNSTMEFDIAQMMYWMEGNYYPLSLWLQGWILWIWRIFAYRFMFTFVVGAHAPFVNYIIAWFATNLFLNTFQSTLFVMFSWIVNGFYFKNWRHQGYYWFAKYCVKRCARQMKETYIANKMITNVALAISCFLLAHKLFRQSDAQCHPERKKFSPQDDSKAFEDIQKILEESAIKVESAETNKNAVKLEVSDIDEGVKPENKKEVTESVWYKENFELSPCDLTETILSKCSEHDFYSRVARNTFIMKNRFVNEFNVGREKVNRVLGLRGNLYLTNFHGVHVRTDGSLLFELTQGCDQGVTSRAHCLVSKDQWHRPEGTDLLYMVINARPPVADITKLFPLSTLNTIMNGKYIVRELDGSVSLIDVYRIKKTMHFDPKTSERFEVWFGSVNQDTAKGECGSPLIAETGLGRMILGIHLLGAPGSVGAIKVCLEDIIIAEQKICTYLSEASYIHISAPGFARHLGDLNNKSVFRYLQNGQANVFGSFQGFRTKPKSMVAKSLIHDELQEQGIESKWTKPVMTGWEPWRKAVEPIVKPKMTFNPKYLHEATEDYFEQIMANVDRQDLEELCELDWHSTINGVDGVRFLDKVNRSTSAGAPFRKSKKYFSHPCDDDDMKIEFDEVIMGECKVVISKYENGQQYHPVFTGALKDEPVTWAKFHAKKTRMFAGSPLPWSLVVRKYLLTFIRLFQKNSFIFEGMVGVNCHSKDWDEIRKYLTEFGFDTMIAGDFKAFDKGMFADFILAAFNIIKRIHIGYICPTHLHKISMIALDTAYPVVDVNGDLVQFFGFNPSGQPLTVIINCIVHSLYMRYVFFYLLDKIKSDTTHEHHEALMKLIEEKGPKLKFRDFIRLATYGDDGASGVSKQMPWYNHTTIRDTLLEIGIEYTMADKESESIPYIHIDEVSFLKRVWKFDERFNCHVAPLEMDSIHKSLMVTVVSRSIPRQQQMMATIRSALMECFYHGKEVFDKYSAMLKKICEREDLAPWVDEHTFPLYDQLVYNFESAKQMLKYVASE